MPFNVITEEKSNKIHGEFRIPGILDETIVVEVPCGTSLDAMLRFVKEIALDKLHPEYTSAKSCWINSNTFYYNFQYYKVEFKLEGVSL